MSRQDNDPIEDLKEWQEHQYNLPYWINRNTPFFPPKRGWGMFLFEFIQYLLMLAGFILIAIANYYERDNKFIAVLVILGVFLIMATLRMLKFKPKKKTLSQVKRDALRRRENKERKRDLPRRRKDYK